MEERQFDEKTLQKLGYYVYALIDPIEGNAFYIGKGLGNRVFNHANGALETETTSDKYDQIRRIHSAGRMVHHVIIRHGLSEAEALGIESAIIDCARFFGHKLTNIVSGHHSIDNGLMTCEAIIGKYNAPKLENLGSDTMIININRSYQRGSGFDGIYKATKESWVIGPKKRGQIKFVLAEYRGLIVEVFQVLQWYPKETIDKKGKTKIRWGFDGVVASGEVREMYINRSVAHVKEQGAANPIRYSIEKRAA